MFEIRYATGATAYDAVRDQHCLPAEFGYDVNIYGGTVTWTPCDVHGRILEGVGCRGILTSHLVAVRELEPLPVPGPQLSPTGDGLSVIAGRILAVLADCAYALHWNRSLDFYQYGQHDGSIDFPVDYVTGATFTVELPLVYRGDPTDTRPYYIDCASWDMDRDRVRSAYNLQRWAERLQGAA